MKNKNEKLTQTQKSYAKKRIQDIRSDCRQVIRRSMSRNIITFGDVYKQIKTKKPHPPKNPERQAYMSIGLNEFFDFKYELETREDFEKRVDSKVAEMTLESNRIIDEIMLGDATNAIKKISDFEKKWSSL